MWNAFSHYLSISARDNINESYYTTMAENQIVNKLVDTVECKQGAVRTVRFNVDGNYCMTGGSDKSVKLWNPHKGVLLKNYSGHGYDVLDVHGSCDNSQLCSCGLDKTVILWDVATGKIVRKYRGHAGHLNCVRFNEESTVILSGSIDGSIRVWDCRSRKMEPIQVRHSLLFVGIGPIFQNW